MNASATAEVVADQCVCEIGEIDAMTNPCSVCPHAAMNMSQDEFPENCPLATKARPASSSPWSRG